MSRLMELVGGTDSLYRKRALSHAGPIRGGTPGPRFAPDDGSDGDDGDGNAGAGGQTDDDDDDASDDPPPSPPPPQPKPTGKDKRDPLMVERARRKQLEKELEETRKRALAPDEIERFRKMEEEQKRKEEQTLAQQGEYKKLLKKSQQELQAEREEKERIRAESESRIASMQIDNVLASTIPQYTAVPISDIAPLLRNRLKFDPESGSVIPVDSHGDQLINDKGEPMTADEFISHEINQRPHFASARPKNGSGGVSQTGGKGKVFTQDQIERMSAKEYAAHRESILGQIG